MASEHIDVLNAILDFAGDRLETKAEKKEDVRWNKQLIATLQQADTTAQAKIDAADKVATARKREFNISEYGKEVVETGDKTYRQQEYDQKLRYDYIITERDVELDPLLTKGMIMTNADKVAYDARRNNRIPLGENYSVHLYGDDSRASHLVDLKTHAMIQENYENRKGVDPMLVKQYLGKDIHDEWSKLEYGPNEDEKNFKYVNNRDFSIMIAAAQSGMGVDAAMTTLRREDRLVAERQPLLSEVDVTAYETSKQGWMGFPLDPFNEEDIYATITGENKKLNATQHTLPNITRDADNFRILHETKDKAGNRIGSEKSDSALRQLRHYMDILGTDDRFWDKGGGWSIWTDEHRNAKNLYIQSQMTYKQITGENYKPADTSKYQKWIQTAYFGGAKPKTPIGQIPTIQVSGGAADVWPASPARPKYPKIHGTGHWNRASGQAERSGEDVETVLQGPPWNYTPEQAAYLVAKKSK